MSLTRPATAVQKAPSADPPVYDNLPINAWGPLFRLWSIPHGWFQSLIRRRELEPPSVAHVLCTVCFVAFARTELEVVTLGLKGATVPSLINNTVFYFQAAYLYAFLASRLTKRSVDSVMGVVTIGLAAGILPPVIDALVLGLGRGRYTYVDGGFGVWQWSLVDPHHFSVGESVALWLVVAMFSAYVCEVTRSWRITAVAALSAYAAVVFIAMVPSSLVRLVAGSLQLPSSHYLALLSTIQLVVGVAVYLGARPTVARRLVWRLVHALPFVALVFLGASLSAWFQPTESRTSLRLMVTGVMVLGIFMLCVVALIQNDAFDATEDRGRIDRTHPNDASFFTAVGLLLVSAICAASASAGAPMVLFLIGAVMYSFPFGRIKRSFPGNYLTEGVWGWSAFIAGASAPLVLRDRVEPSAGALISSVVVFLGWFLFNAFKDVKDVRPDFRANNQTLYVWALRSGVRLSVVHRRFCRALAISLLIPPLGLLGVGVSPLPVAAAVLVSIPLVLAALNGPPATASVRRFLVGIAVYVASLAAAVELTLADVA